MLLELWFPGSYMLSKWYLSAISCLRKGKTGTISRLSREYLKFFCWAGGCGLVSSVHVYLAALRLTSVKADNIETSSQNTQNRLQMNIPGTLRKLLHTVILCLIILKLVLKDFVFINVLNSNVMAKQDLFLPFFLAWKLGYSTSLLTISVLSGLEDHSYMVLHSAALFGGKIK